MDYRFDWLPLDAIDSANTFYRITTTLDKPPILESIRRIGLICPVLVKEAQHRFMVISGFRRIESCQQLEKKTIPCLILPASDKDRQCAELAISHNLTQRPLNLVEQARCFHLLGNVTSTLKESLDIANALGLSFNRDLITKLNTILDCPAVMRDGLVEGKLSLTMALLMSELSPEDAESMAILFERLPMGQNKQREILVNLKETAARDGQTLKSILEEEPVKAIMNDDRMDGNQKSRALRAYCRKRRFPRIVQTEEDFNANIRNLRLGDSIQLTPPPGFEGSSYTLTIRIETLEDLKQARLKIDEAIENPALSRLFDAI